MKLTDLLNEDVYVKNKETGNVYDKEQRSIKVPPSKGEVDKLKKMVIGKHRVKKCES